MSHEMKFSVLAHSLKLEEEKCTALNAVLKRLGFSESIPFHNSDENPDFVFIYCAPGTDVPTELSSSRLDNSIKILLVDQNAEEPPEAWLNHQVNDLLVTPIRPLELLSKISQIDLHRGWQEVSYLQVSFSELMENLKADLKLTERLQKLKIPNRFQTIKNFQVFGRYLAGMKTGGEYLDAYESKDESRLSVVMSDSSSYGLSSAVLTSLMRLTAKLSTSAESGTAAEVISEIIPDFQATLSEKDSLSFFLGSLRRTDLTFEYVSLGTVYGFHYKHQEKKWVQLKSSGTAISQKNLGSDVKSHTVDCEPGDRVVLVSDGYLSLFEDEKKFSKFLDEWVEKEPVELLNELSFQAKRGLEEGMELAKEDCSSLWIGIPARTMRVVPLREKKA